MGSTDKQSQFRVARTTHIDAAPETVFSFIEDFHRWTQWSPWEGLDEQLRRTYSGPSAGVGAGYNWAGNRRAGSGSMTIVDSLPPSTITIELNFEKPFKATNTARFELARSSTGTNITWEMTGRKTFFSRVFPIDRMIGRDFEKGLAALKSQSESRAV